MRSDDFMNAEDVARYLNLGKNTVYQLAKSGQIASYHVGRKLRFTLEDVEAYVASTHQALSSAQSSQETVAPGSEVEEGVSKAAAFGELDGAPFAIAGGDTAADILAGTMNSTGMPTARKVCGSYTALVNLYAGDADAAVAHLYDQASNTYNLPYVRNLAPGASVIVFRLYGRQIGFIVQMGNPKKLTTWGSLLHEGVRLANRVKGCGARVLLDEKLRAMEARTDVIEGYGRRYKVGTTAARSVAGGVADVAIGTERDMHGISGLQFIPMQKEWIDLVVRKAPESRAGIKRIKELLADEDLRRDIAALKPCDYSKLGVVVYES